MRLGPVLAGGAAGDGNTIRNTLRTIGRDTAALGEAMSAWSGSVLSVLPVSGADALLVALEHGAHMARVSTPMTVDEALSVAAAANCILAALVAARPKFDALHLGPVVAVRVRVERAAAADFVSYIVDKVPGDLRPLAMELVKSIDDSFERTVKALH